MTPTHKETETIVSNEPGPSTSPQPAHFVVWLWKQARRVVVFVVGSTVLLIGILMIVGPGPAVVVIPLGLAILATEFVWARDWLAYAKRHLNELAARTPKSSRQNMTPGTPRKSRTQTARGYPPRQPVAEADADWARPLEHYSPPLYTAPIVFEREGIWADPDDIHLVHRRFQTRTADGDVDVRLDPEGWPLNPLGRTGIRGRGLLGRWGRNQAGDPLVTRIDPMTGRAQVLVIERNDSGQMALPGGMVDDGESITQTVARELLEETGVILNFDDAATLFTGIVDDPRNTDNAWMETTVLHKHLTSTESAAVDLKAGDDARTVSWRDIDDRLLATLYASHAEYVRLALNRIAPSGGKGSV